MKNILLLLLLFVLSCSSPRTVLIEYNYNDYISVIDSIKKSGTHVGPLNTYNFMLDDKTNDKVMISTLYKKNKSSGSIQIRKVDSLYNIKIIDIQYNK